MPAQNGQLDSFFIAECRRILRDQPVWATDPFSTDGSTGAITAGNKPFKLSRSPVVKAGAVLQAPGGPYTVVYDTAPSVGPPLTAEIVSDTGEVIFVAAPASGSLLVTYQAFRFSDQQILDALLEGLNLLWPEIWNPTRIDNAIFISPVTFEYALPAQFQDPNVQLLLVEFRPPSGIIRYFTSSEWELVRDSVSPLIAFHKLPPVASVIRFTYTQPFTALAQTPPLVQHLPVYYALARLLGDQETMRSRSDDAVGLRGEAAQRPGTAISISAYWLDRFEKQLDKLSMTLPVRRQVMSRVAERLGLGPIWRSD